MDDKNQLEISVEQAEKAATLDRHPGWEFIKEWLTRGRKIHEDDLKSFKYINDHNGYITSLARYNAYNDILTFIDLTISRGVEAKKELDELEQSDN